MEVCNASNDNVTKEQFRLLITEGRNIIQSFNQCVCTGHTVKINSYSMGKKLLSSQLEDKREVIHLMFFLMATILCHIDMDFCLDIQSKLGPLLDSHHINGILVKIWCAEA